MVVHERKFLQSSPIRSSLSSFQGDISRFADRSRELWSEHTHSEVRYKQSSESAPSSRHRCWQNRFLLMKQIFFVVVEVVHSLRYWPSF